MLVAPRVALTLFQSRSSSLFLTTALPLSPSAYMKILSYELKFFEFPMILNCKSEISNMGKDFHHSYFFTEMTTRKSGNPEEVSKLAVSV